MGKPPLCCLHTLRIGQEGTGPACRRTGGRCWLCPSWARRSASLPQHLRYGVKPTERRQTEKPGVSRPGQGWARCVAALWLAADTKRLSALLQHRDASGVHVGPDSEQCQQFVWKGKGLHCAPQSSPQGWQRQSPVGALPVLREAAAHEGFSPAAT